MESMRILFPEENTESAQVRLLERMSWMRRGFLEIGMSLIEFRAP